MNDDRRKNALNIAQTFYDKLAAQYDKLFLDRQSAAAEHAELLERIFFA